MSTFNSQLSLVSELVVALVEQLVIHLHEQLDCIVDQTVNCLVPVRLGVVVKCREHYRQNHCGVLGDKRHNVVVVPVVQGAFGHLEVRWADAFGDLSKERHHHFLELGWLYDVENFFQLVQEHDFFRTVSLRPKLEESSGRCQKWYVSDLQNNSLLNILTL